MKDRVSKVDAAVSQECRRAADFLAEIVAMPSVEGSERDVQERIARALAEADLEVSFVPIPERLREDPEYSHTAAPSYSGRFNISARRHGTGGGRSLIINTHSDVVAAPDWPEAFSPRLEDECVRGRGAVDAKGQVATVYLVLLALQRLRLHVAGALDVQIVIDEEVGGNGTLSLLRGGRAADAALVMEPTALALQSANRGALWFRFTIAGEAAHMARKFEAASAVDYTVELINILGRFEKDLLERAKGYELFAASKHPVQVNVGKVTAGEWPATVAARSVVEGGIGFLPDTAIDDIKQELVERIEREGSGWLRSHYDLQFHGLHNEAFETKRQAPVVRRFQAALENTGLDAAASGWPASCDARLLAKVGGMDTIVFGPGDLALAHSNRERICVAEMEIAAHALVRFIIDWCR